jgi:hypothetical protein
MKFSLFWVVKQSMLVFAIVSGKHRCPILLDHLTLEDGTNGLYQNFGKQIPKYAV